MGCVSAGADLFLRPAYVPSMQSHRMHLLSPRGRLLSVGAGAGVEGERGAQGRVVTIAGTHACTALHCTLLHCILMMLYIYIL